MTMLSNVEVVEVVNPLAAIEQRVTSINPTMEPDAVLAVYDKLRYFAGELKRLSKLADAQVMEWVKANGELRISPTEYYCITTPKDTTCNDVPAVLAWAVEFFEGDWAKMCGVLRSDPIKHGQCRELMPPETYAKLFTTTVKEDLDTGKVKKVLARLNEKFLK